MAALDASRVGQWLVENSLPLTCLEFYFEVKEVQRQTVEPALEYAKRSCAAHSSAVISTVVQEDWIPLLIVDYLRQKGEKLAAITVEEAFSDSIRVARQSAVNRPSLIDVVRLSRLAASSRDGEDAENMTNIDLDARCSALQGQLVAAQREIEELRGKFLELRPQPQIQREQTAEHVIVKDLADRLPTVISAVGTEKKDVLVPIITSVIEHHPAATTRSSLLYALLNLFRKPTADQRAVLVDGIVALCQRIGTERVEQEVVPELWGLASHRYYEKRTLIVACALKLAPFVCKGTRGAFVSSILTPCSVDRSSTVRSLTATALAAVWTDFDGKELHQALELLVTLYLDDKRVVQDAVEKAFPLIVRKCLDSPQLTGLLIVTILSAIEKLSPQESAYEPSVGVATTPEKTVILLGALRKVFDYIKSDERSERLPPMLELFQVTVFPMCIQLLGSPGFACRDRFVHELAATMSTITMLFGVLLFAAVGELFADAIRRAQNNDEAVTRQAFLTAMVVHFCCVAPSAGLGTPERKSVVGSGSQDAQVSFILSSSVDLLVNCFVDLAAHGQTDADLFASALQVVCKKYPLGISTVVNVLWRAVEHPSPFLRKIAAGVVLQCGGAASEEALVRFFWPQLLVLINDKVEEVQHTAVRAAFTLSALPVASSPATQEKMFSTLFAAVESTSVVSPMTLLYLSQWRDNMKSVPSEPRETYLYPQLTSICRQLLEQKGKEPRHEVMSRLLRLLLDVFQSISTCAVVSPQLVKSTLTPALKLLGKEFDASPDRSAYHALLKDYAQIEHRLKPQVEPRSFFDKVKDEIKKHV